MADQSTTIAQLKEKVATFIKAREWNQFHSPKNLSMAIAAEVAELMEHFLWVESKESFAEYEKNKIEVEHEIADVAFALLSLCNALHLDLSEIMLRKIAIQEQKYPVEKSKGSFAKYTKLNKD